jgi:hypothetical protein
MAGPGALDHDLCFMSESALPGGTLAGSSEERYGGGMRWMRAPAVRAAALLLLLGPVSCDKESVVTQYAKVRKACRAGDRAAAKKITEGLREDYPKFKIAFDEAVGEAGDRQVDYCSPLVISGTERRLNSPE